MSCSACDYFASLVTFSESTSPYGIRRQLTTPKYTFICAAGSITPHHTTLHWPSTTVDTSLLPFQSWRPTSSKNPWTSTLRKRVFLCGHSHRRNNKNNSVQCPVETTTYQHPPFLYNTFLGPKDADFRGVWRLVKTMVLRHQLFPCAHTFRQSRNRLAFIASHRQGPRSKEHFSPSPMSSKSTSSHTFPPKIF